MAVSPDGAKRPSTSSCDVERQTPHHPDSASITSIDYAIETARVDAHQVKAQLWRPRRQRGAGAAKSEIFRRGSPSQAMTMNRLDRRTSDQIHGRDGTEDKVRRRRRGPRSKAGSAIEGSPGARRRSVTKPSARQLACEVTKHDIATLLGRHPVWPQRHGDDAGTEGAASTYRAPATCAAPRRRCSSGPPKPVGDYVTASPCVNAAEETPPKRRAPRVLVGSSSIRTAMARPR